MPVSYYVFVSYLVIVFMLMLVNFGRGDKTPRFTIDTYLEVAVAQLVRIVIFGGIALGMYLEGM